MDWLDWLDQVMRLPTCAPPVLPSWLKRLAKFLVQYYGLHDPDSEITVG